MNELASLLSAFAVDSIYKGTHAIAAVVVMYLSPTLLMVSIYIRLMETQLDSVVGNGKIGVALRDILAWGFALGAYFAIGNLVTEYFNSIYVWADSIGSVKKIIETFPEIMAKAGYKEETGVAAILPSIASMSPFAVIVEGFYFITIIVISALSAFLRIAVALCFGIAFIWGLIAIPISISTSFRILRAWGWLLGFSLIWPLIEAILLGLMGLCFAEAASRMQAITGDSILAGSSVKALLCVCNLVVCAGLITAPFLANALVTNTSAATGVVMPFVTAALTAAKAGVSLIKPASNTSTVNSTTQMPTPGPTPRQTPKSPAVPTGPQMPASTSPSTPHSNSAATLPPTPPVEVKRKVGNDAGLS